MYNPLPRRHAAGREVKRHTLNLESACGFVQPCSLSLFCVFRQAQKQIYCRQREDNCFYSGRRGAIQQEGLGAASEADDFAFSPLDVPLDVPLCGFYALVPTVSSPSLSLVWSAVEAANVVRRKYSSGHAFPCSGSPLFFSVLFSPPVN